MVIGVYNFIILYYNFLENSAVIIIIANQLGWSYLNQQSVVWEQELVGLRTSIFWSQQREKNENQNTGLNMSSSTLFSFVTLNLLIALGMRFNS